MNTIEWINQLQTVADLQNGDDHLLFSGGIVGVGFAVVGLQKIHRDLRDVLFAFVDKLFGEHFRLTLGHRPYDARLSQRDQSVQFRVCGTDAVEIRLANDFFELDHLYWRRALQNSKIRNHAVVVDGDQARVGAFEADANFHTVFRKLSRLSVHRLLELLEHVWLDRSGEHFQEKILTVLVVVDEVTRAVDNGLDQLVCSFQRHQQRIVVCIVGGNRHQTTVAVQAQREHDPDDGRAHIPSVDDAAQRHFGFVDQPDQTGEHQQQQPDVPLERLQHHTFDEFRRR
ncbi:hypothetical protein T08_11848 [Trichinella sp. T8]|nr:hypothetical protein T08_11848 [Trichinella sp. T8]